MKFWKVEAIGNDFPLVHLGDVSSGDLPALASKMCDRRFGVGGDGLLAVGMDSADVHLRMFNPDGTEDFCGNGLRCAAIHARSQGWVGVKCDIRHVDRCVPTEINDGLVSTTIGVASYSPSDIPVRFDDDPDNTFDRMVWQKGAIDARGSVLTTGSTHTIIPGPLPNDATINKLGPQIEHAPQFPSRTSVIWSEVMGPMMLRIRIWERAVGETQGCGTGSAAAAVDYLRRTGVGGTVEVRNPGGVVSVTARAWDAPVTVRGEAREVFEGVWP
ncbi:MAG: diaminopimelate epimerase [Fimbriimonadaceae bacterium]